MPQDLCAHRAGGPLSGVAVMTWLSTYYIWVLIVATPGGLESQLGVYPSLPACEAARDLYGKDVPRGMELTVECRERVRATYGK